MFLRDLCRSKCAKKDTTNKTRERTADDKAEGPSGAQEGQPMDVEDTSKTTGEQAADNKVEGSGGAQEGQPIDVEMVSSQEEDNSGTSSHNLDKSDSPFESVEDYQ